MRFRNQTTAMGGEPHAVLAWFFQQNQTLEKQLHAALDRYSASKPIGQWARGGIGPVIAAGLIAHIDIKQCPTAGHIWRFAGLDPTSKWGQGEKRPWNAGLKTLCWHIGQSFMKLHNNENCFYGKIYEQRKAYEQQRNDSGGNAEPAKELAPKFRKTTESDKHLMAGHLPPAQIDARARRYAIPGAFPRAMVRDGVREAGTAALSHRAHGAHARGTPSIRPKPPSAIKGH